MSKFAHGTALNSTGGKARMWLKAFIGPKPGCPPPAAALVICRRVVSIITSGYRNRYASPAIASACCSSRKSVAGDGITVLIRIAPSTHPATAPLVATASLAAERERDDARLLVRRSATLTPAAHAGIAPSG